MPSLNDELMQAYSCGFLHFRRPFILIDPSFPEYRLLYSLLDHLTYLRKNRVSKLILMTFLSENKKFKS